MSTTIKVVKALAGAVLFLSGFVLSQKVYYALLTRLFVPAYGRPETSSLTSHVPQQYAALVFAVFLLPSLYLFGLTWLRKWPALLLYCALLLLAFKPLQFAASVLAK